MLLHGSTECKSLDQISPIESSDLRFQKENIHKIIDNNRFYPGYHMNKNNWITIKLDNSVETKKIFELIDNSYNLSLKK